MTTIVDANILLYAKFTDYAQHAAALEWLDGALNASQPVGLPWQSLSAFVRIATNSRVFASPLAIGAAVAQIRLWCERAVVWHPEPGEAFAGLFADLLIKHHCTANLVTDAHLAALALEHGLSIVSSDTDFARFPAVTWVNPLV